MAVLMIWRTASRFIDSGSGVLVLITVDAGFKFWVQIFADFRIDSGTGFAGSDVTFSATGFWDWVWCKALLYQIQVVH